MPDLDRNKIIKELLKTAEGKHKLSGVVKNLIQEEIDKFGLVRKILNHDILPSKNVPAIYDVLDTSEVLYVNNEVRVNSILNRRKVVVPLFKLSTSIQIPFNELRSEDISSVIMRHSQEAAKELVLQENKTLFDLLNFNCTHLKVIDFKTSLIEADQEFNKNDLEITNIIANSRLLPELEKYDTEKTINVFISEHCKENEIFVLPDSRFVGALPEIPELSWPYQDSMDSLTIGWSVYETIGMAIFDSLKTVIKVEIIHSTKFLELLNHKNKYRFINVE